jgi:hypothetical protein
MKRSQLEKFVSKYNLGGAAEMVNWVSDSDGLTTKFKSDDHSVLGFITAKEIELDHGTYSIYDTTKLLGLLRVLDEDVTVTVSQDRGYPSALMFKDSLNTKVTAVLADPKVIPPAPTPKNFPPFELVMTMDAKFVNMFSKGVMALREEDGFTIISDGKQAEMILGYEAQTNTNRVTFSVETTQNAVLKPVRFHAKYLKSILAANKEGIGTLSISSHGLGHVKYAIDGWTIDYYLTGMK